jgi:hypothetical protein
VGSNSAFHAAEKISITFFAAFSRAVGLNQRMSARLPDPVASFVRPSIASLTYGAARIVAIRASNGNMQGVYLKVEGPERQV